MLGFFRYYFVYVGIDTKETRLGLIKAMNINILAYFYFAVAIFTWITCFAGINALITLKAIYIVVAYAVLGLL